MNVGFNSGSDRSKGEKDCSKKAPGPENSGSGNGGFARVNLKKTGNLLQDEPPLTPQSALSYALIVSRVSSSDLDKRRISHKAMGRIVALEKKYSRDERALSFLQSTWSLVTIAGVSIGDSNKAMNRDLEQAAELRDSKIKGASECMKSSVEHHRDIRNMRIDHLEKSKMLKSVSSVAAWFTSIGVTATTLYEVKDEIIDLLSKIYPAVRTVDHIIYAAGGAFLLGAAFGIKKIVNRVIDRKQENAENEFHTRKSEAITLYQKKKEKAGGEFNSTLGDLVRKHVAETAKLAGSVYANVYMLCVGKYPGSLKGDPSYSRYLEIKEEHGEMEAYDFLMEVGRAEAERQLSSKRFLTETTVSHNIVPEKKSPGGSGIAA